MQHILKKFWNPFEKIILNGPKKTSTVTGCNNIETSIQNTLSYKIPLKNKDINSNIKNMANTTRYFQWLTGDRKGDIVFFDKIVEEDNIRYMTFKDGSRCNIEFILPLNEKQPEGKAIAEVEHPNNVWTFKEEEVGGQEEIWDQNSDGEKVCVQPYLPGKKVIKAIPPKHSLKNLNIEYTPSPEFPVISMPIIQKPKDEVYILLDKAKKVDTLINLNVILPLPTTSFYNVINESFENGGQKLAEYIIENIDVEVLKSSIKLEIIKLYEQ